jgi:hypothetical protein
VSIMPKRIMRQCRLRSPAPQESHTLAKPKNDSVVLLGVLSGFSGGGAGDQGVDVLGNLFAGVGGGHSGFGERHGGVGSEPHIPSRTVDLEPEIPAAAIRDDQMQTVTVAMPSPLRSLPPYP